MTRKELCTDIYEKYKTMCASNMCQKCKYWVGQRNCVVDFTLAYLEEHDLLKEGSYIEEEEGK